ncbi:carcinoembryonic antigen-related cell adhesion molecule 6-like isoform X2 [Ursus americanus]|uniref:carcinoembryonic antigen-related cell adhesion molecule 6-like isoform X2 n=1 Tax=Ursus americanus TaxID=9643 RepID=UPI001E67BB39|nr:carcinoembryonic antigen-related cell adhesion molecule 6-like isoform X2 [Ursus americanus]
MEPPSAPPRGGHVPWQELLLAVSLLTFWNLPTTAQVTVESVPPDAAEGKDVLLRAHSLPGDLLGCNWFRGETANTSHQILLYVVDTQVTTPGPAHSGRETIYPNGSLLFQRVTLNDTGYYTLQTVTKNAQVEQGTGQIRVFPELPKPNITSNNSDPVENVDSVVLTCEPQTQSTSYLWSVNSKSLPASARLELSLDNRTLTIHRVTRNDTGPYECETRNPVSADGSDPFTLNVLYGPDAPTISPSDSHYRPGASLRLSCHAASNPPARYSWLINGRPQPSTQELFIPSLTVNDSGAYTCIASNSGTRLNKTTVQTITVSGDSTQPSSGLPPGAIAGIVIGVLAGVAVIAALVYFLFTRKSGGASDLRDVTEHKPSASNHSQDHADNLSNKIEEVAYSSLTFNTQEPKKSTSAPPSPAATETVYTEVQRK